MRVTAAPIGAYHRDPNHHGRSDRNTSAPLKPARHGRIIDMVDLSPQHDRGPEHPAWLETYLRLLPDDEAASRTRQAFGQGEEALLERLLFEIL